MKAQAKQTMLQLAAPASVKEEDEEKGLPPTKPNHAELALAAAKAVNKHKNLIPAAEKQVQFKSLLFSSSVVLHDLDLGSLESFELVAASKAIETWMS